MNLPFLKQKPNTEYFISLVFRDDRVSVFVFEKENDVIKIINSQEEIFSESLDKTSYDDLLDAADKVISQAEDELNLSIEIQKTIFGLKESWVKDGKIKPENLETLKKLSDNLGLIPIGFLTIPEAVVSLLQKEEGAPPSAILVDVGQDSVTVSSVRAGKVIEIKSAEIHQSPVFTVDTLLKHFQVVEILPAKIVLLNEDEELVQEFISHQWSKSLPFLHLPQIVSLESDSIAKAYAIGLANQTGAEVKNDSFEPSSPAERNEEEDGRPAATATEEETEDREQISGEEQVKSNIEYVDTPDFFGFSNNDVANTPPPAPEVENVKAEVFEEVPEEVELKETEKQLIPAQIMVVLPKIRNLVFSLLSKIKDFVFNFQGKVPVNDKKIIYIALPLILILLFIIYYLFFLKADVRIFVNSKVAEKQENIVFSTTGSDFKNDTLKASFVSVSEDGTATDPATGKKQTGDKAKGTVTIFNQLSSDQTIPSGTIIKSQTSTPLEFTLDNGVTIPAVATHSADVASTPTTQTVTVTASTFGTEYNLPSGTKFTVGNYNSGDVVAKNDNPFSGGTTKDIQVVSSDDVSKVESDLIKNLEDKARSDIKSKLDPSSDVLPNFLDESIDKKDFDKNVDDEAKSVTLKGTVSFTGISYNRDEFINFLKTVFGENQSIDKNNIEVSFDNLTKSSDSEASAKMNIKVKITPDIDIASLKKRIANQTFIKAKNEITGMDQVTNAEIKFSPNLFFLPKTLPRLPNNITITVVEND